MRKRTRSGMRVDKVNVAKLIGWVPLSVELVRKGFNSCRFIFVNI